ncbi:unnamed protein product [Caenorhabditis sp. 36 PRJEB53466]|nr:unnamed protein product [Caenorhabditis sp. 36 PRJEB53466]
MAFRPNYGMPSYPHYPQQQQQIVFGQMRMPVQHPPAAAPVRQQEPTPVFVGNISEKCTDEFIQKMLNECGHVTSWKRIKGNNGKLQGFGFCNFSDLEGTLRALRILHDFHLGDKKLTVKAEEKVRHDLRKTAIENRKRQGKKELKLKDGELPADEDDLKKDEEIRLKILHWMETDHKELFTVTEDGEVSDELKKTRAQDGKLAEKSATSSGAGTLKRDDRSRRHRTRSRDGRSRRSRSKDSPRSKKSRRSPSSSGSSSGSGSSTSRSSSYSSRSRTPDRKKASSSKRRRSLSRSSEDSDDAREKRIIKNMMKEKEQAYHARLNRWESRERQMAKKYEKEERKEKDRKKNIQKEHKKLKLFLEDYDDERDDPKFFKSSLFFQRKRDFEREREADQKDRLQEILEIEELKKQIMAEASSDATINVDEEARKRHQLKEEEAMRKLRADSGSPNPHQPLGQSANGANGESSSDDESGSEKTDGKKEEEEAESKEHNGAPGEEETDGPARTTVTETTRLGGGGSVTIGPGGWKAIGGDSHAAPSIVRPTSSSSSVPKKEPSPIPIAQRLSGVFGNDDDEDEMHKRKKLKPFEITREERAQVMTADEKKELTKQIIKKIPLTKEELFLHKIEWDQLDRQWMNDRIRPWVAKKVSSFLGEEDTTFCDFICEQLALQTSPDKILKDVAVIIDEDAEQFVIKMWRLLIYEGQARRLGIT